MVDARVTMPLAVAERLYWAIIELPANLTPELCEAVESFHRYVRLSVPPAPDPEKEAT